ncbi:MAG: response regulator transcription factor [Firmicutes bacterium]|nr:response regulator transcription factor [Bacillota bacterium]
MTKICCIEDDAGVRELVLCALKHSGFEAEGYADAAAFYAADADFDLFVLDIMLPETDGITLLKELKSNVRYMEKPVIMLTAKSMEIDKIQGLDAGADDYMTKPFGVMELISRINAVLRRYKIGSHTLLRDGNLVFDDTSKKVTYNGTPVSVTLKEMDTLKFLLKRKGSVVSREELMNNVWGYEYIGASRTVDMHIKTLRRKLEEHGCEDLIKTVRGLGYMIE